MKRHLIAALSTLVLATPTLAQVTQDGPVADTPGPQDTDQQWGVEDIRDDTYMMSVEDIEVRSVDGERIGEIEEILVDSDGIPAGFVIDIGGWLGIGVEEVAVPLEALTFANNEYVSKMTVQQLENLPEWHD